jgi:SpoVK/Ycf46/Vps4 family AAA+-type ATPase
MKSLLKTEKTITFTRKTEILPVIEAGMYTLSENYNSEITLTETTILSDKISSLNSDRILEALNNIDNFFSQKTQDKYKKHGFLHKRGYCFYGPHGTGKTCLVRQILTLTKEKYNAIVLINPAPYLLSTFKLQLEAVDPGRKIIVLWEEFEKICCHDESALLNVMDGIDSFDNVLFICTTNYIDQVPDRIKYRTSRVADLCEIGLPEPKDRHNYLSFIMGSEAPLEWVEKTHNFSLDHLKELYISVHIMDIPFEVALDKIKKITGEAFVENKNKNDDDDDDYDDDDK